MLNQSIETKVSRLKSTRDLSIIGLECQKNYFFGEEVGTTSVQAGKLHRNLSVTKNFVLSCAQKTAKTDK